MSSSSVYNQNNVHKQRDSEIDEYYDESFEEAAVLKEQKTLAKAKKADAPDAPQQLGRLPWYIREYEDKRTALWRRKYAPKMIQFVAPMDETSRKALYELIDACKDRSYWVPVLTAFFEQYPEAMVRRPSKGHALTEPAISDRTGKNPAREKVIADVQYGIFGGWSFESANARAPNPVPVAVGPKGETNTDGQCDCRCRGCKASWSMSRRISDPIVCLARRLKVAERRDKCLRKASRSLSLMLKTKTI
jgi:hypothetical protein